MNDTIAEETLENHKYLLQEVQNRAAIAFFAASNRNLSLYNALKKFIMENEKDDSGSELETSSLSDEYANEEQQRLHIIRKKKRELKNMKRKRDIMNTTRVLPKNLPKQIGEYLERNFDKMLFYYDFMSVVMYPDLKNRRFFVHDAWEIAKYTENFELKMAIANDPYFYITRADIF